MPAPPVLRSVGDDDSEVYVVGVRAGDHPDSWSLLFMAADAADDQDIEFGMDTYCLVLDSGQATYCGGVAACRLQPDRLSLQLTPEAAGALGLPAELSFGLALTDDEYRTLRTGQRRVLTSGRPSAIPADLDLPWYAWLAGGAGVIRTLRRHLVAGRGRSTTSVTRRTTARCRPAAPARTPPPMLQRSGDICFIRTTWSARPEDTDAGDGYCNGSLATSTAYHRIASGRVQPLKPK